MPLRYLVPLAVFVFFAAILGYLLVSGHDSSRIPSVLIDQPAPRFELPPLDDSRPGLATADLSGTVSVVNVFASWCVPCRAEHPLLMRLAEEGIDVHGINYKDDREKIRVWLDDLGNPYKRIGFDENGRAAIEWGVYGIPETFILDDQGRVRYKHVGPMTPYDLNNVILPIIEGLRS
ncbi:MAG: DsbE family thiol:disulfide interchange protein [Alphaproteobacteria bacterium]|nr:DsbE family thiol:disulfide interchange protein [Alphaproteobacteria bacterium]